MPSADFYMKAALYQRREAGCLRALGTYNSLIDFASNDYFGWAKSSELKERFVQQFIRDENVGLGAGGSRLLTGNNPLTEEAEEEIARFHEAEKALLLSSGYMANVGLIASIAKREDVLIRDACVHASMVDGCRLSLASSFHFRHNDLLDLEAKLQRFQHRRCFVLIESLYSMEGDFAPLLSIVDLCRRYHAQLLVDEAHALGVMGAGLLQKLNLQHQVFARIVTYGKALGLQGAAILGSNTLISYLINYCRPFIFSTGMSPIHVHAIKVGYDFLRKGAAEHLRQLLQQKCQLFNECLGREEWDAFISPIQIVIIPGNNEVDHASNYLYQEGFDVRAMKSPTVKKGQERLRICLHTFNSDEEIQRLVQCVKEITSFKK